MSELWALNQGDFGPCGRDGERFESSREHQSVLQDCQFLSGERAEPQSGQVPHDFRSGLQPIGARDLPLLAKHPWKRATVYGHQKPASMGGRSASQCASDFRLAASQKSLLFRPVRRKFDSHELLSRQARRMAAPHDSVDDFR